MPAGYTCAARLAMRCASLPSSRSSALLSRSGAPARLGRRALVVAAQTAPTYNPQNVPDPVVSPPPMHALHAEWMQGVACTS